MIELLDLRNQPPEVPVDFKKVEEKLENASEIKIRVNDGGHGDGLFMPIECAGHKTKCMTYIADGNFWEITIQKGGGKNVKK